MKHNVALAEAAGGPAALQVVIAVIRDAIRDRAVDDPIAVELLSALAVEDPSFIDHLAAKEFRCRVPTA